MKSKKNNSSAKPNTNSKKQKKKDSLTVNDFLGGFGRWELVSFIIGLLVTALAIFMLMSMVSFLFTGDSDYALAETSGAMSNTDKQYDNVCGSFGANIAFFLINNLFGLASFAIPVYLFFVGFRMMKIVRFTLVRKFILITLGMLWVSVFLATFEDLFLDASSYIRLGGNHGINLVNLLTDKIGKPGLLACLIIYALLYMMYVSAHTIEVIRNIARLNFIKKEKLKLMLSRRTKEEEEEEMDETDVAETPTQNEETPTPQPESQKPITIEFDVKGLETPLKHEEEDELDVNDIPTPEDESSAQEAELEIESHETEMGNGIINRGDITTSYDPKLDLEFYKYPTIELLEQGNNAVPQIDMDEQRANQERIIHVLKNFGVEITKIKATIGPTITLYEIVPAEGTRISKIRNLEDDIALSLAAKGIRIIAPIPGKGTIGIEVPNNNPCVVPMESVLNSKAYQETKMDLPCAIGKTISNEVFMFDLAKAPHLLVAGATGQGKSVGLNAIVASLLYKRHPAELKIVMIDPKKVEFSVYSPIENHFLARLEEEDDCIITDVQKVVKTLNSLCQLMDSRYDLLKKAHVRNIKEYNEKFKNRQLNPDNGHEFMPYVVVIVDEFGDLIMTAGKEVELPICRIAQLARAVGIHMIIATQRPQASIISGAIKTNFPTRIAFKVSSMMDSRVILDRPGAQQLIGKGDMLYLQGAEPVRVQCAFVDTPEVEKICHHIACQQSYIHPMYLPEVAEPDSNSGGLGSFDRGKLDPMFADVARYVVSHENGSTSMIQRNFSIGYNRAGKIMDQLEKMGVVGPQSGAKPREVLIKDTLTLEGLLNSL